MTVNTSKQFFSTNPFATLANDSNQSIGEVDVQLRRRVTAKKRAQLVIDRHDSGLTDPEDDGDDKEDEFTLREDPEEQEIQDTSVDKELTDTNNKNNNTCEQEQADAIIDGTDDRHVHTNNTKEETFEEENHQNTNQGSVRGIRKHDSVVTNEEEEKEDDQDMNETLLSKELTTDEKDDDMVSPKDQEYNQDALDALMTAMTTPTTPPPVMTIMHGGFGVLILVLGSLAIYTWGMPGNWVVWFLFAVNVPLWALVTKLAASIGADEYTTINEELIKANKELTAATEEEEEDDDEELDQDVLFDPNQPRKISKTEMETIQRILDLVDVE